MTHRARLWLILMLAWLGWLLMNPSQSARAQDPDRSSRSDVESRDERRERFRRSFGDRGGDRGSDRGRDSRGFRSRDDERRADDRSSGSGSSSSTNSSGTSGSSRSSTPSTSSASTPAAKPASNSSSPSLNMTDYARSLVKQYDKNGNMMLEADERKELRGRAAESDLNHDGVITIDELVSNLSSPQSAPSSSSASGGNTTSTAASTERSGGGSSNSDRAKTESDKALAGRVFTGTAGATRSITKEGDKRHSYRFSTPYDRAPTGLPSWFKSRDSNGDGQVSMSEWTRYWSSSAAADFRRYDLNDDGVITQKEAASKK